MFSSTSGLTIDMNTGTITPSTSTAGNYTISYETTSNACGITTATAQISITATAAPTATATQSFNSGDTLNNLVVTGTNLQWYDAATGGNVLSTSTPLVDGTTYYVSQTINGCESVRIPVTVNVLLGTDSFTSVKLQYSPNPVKDKLNIVSNRIIDSVTVFNLLGQKVMDGIFGLNAVTLDLSNLPTGNFILQVKSNQENSIIKIIKE